MFFHLCENFTCLCGPKISLKSVYLTLFPKYTHFCILSRNSRLPPFLAVKQFGPKVSDDPVYTLQAKNFVEIGLSHTISEINTFLHFMQKLKMAAKSTVSEINAFLHFTLKFKMAPKSGGKIIFGKKWQMTLHIPYGPKILSELL